MIRNYLIVALRNLKHQLSYSLINIAGLATGLACSMVIFNYVYTEWSYDRHFTNADRIYKIGISFFNMGGFAIGPEALGEYLPKQFEGVEAFTRVSAEKKLPVTVGEQTYEELAYRTDSAFFKVFSYKFEEGNSRTALKHNHSIVLTRSMASKYFPGSDAVGKTVEIGKEKKPYVVTGVVSDGTSSSQLKASIWLSIDDLLTHEANWSSASYYNYVLLKKNNTLSDLEQALDQLLKSEIYPKAMGVPEGLSFESYKEHPNAVKFYVNPLTDVHLKSKLNYEISAGGDEFNIRIFAGIAFFVLILAVVNFINLTTARASRRAKEIGIRKVIGSTRAKLIVQFITESIFMSMLAMILSILLGSIFFWLFEVITGEQLVNTLWSGGRGILLLFAFGLITGFLSGIYPAFYLTASTPLKVLKGNMTARGDETFRNVLVVVQFAISICLMVCTSVVVSQMNFLRNKDLGFVQENVVSIDQLNLAGTHAETFKNELKALPGVSFASLHSGEPGSKSVISFTAYKTPAMTEPLSINTFFADHEFAKMMGLRFVKGRDFNKDLSSDSSAIILNEAAVKALELDEPVGADLGHGYHVIGVVQDFHWESLRNRIAPAAIGRGKNYLQLGVRLNNQTASDFITLAASKWKQLVPDEPMKYHFLDENFGSMLKKEKVFEKAMGFFTMLAIFISCLGLYGLSAYTVTQRKKEIGIRKVMGASTSGIARMLNKQFLVLVTIAVVIALPVSLFAMRSWTSGFAFRAALNVWTITATILAAFAIALATVSYHAVKAAMSNPGETIREL